MEHVAVGNGYLLKIEKGEKINSTLVSFAKKNNVQGAFLHGLGALKNIEIGFYHLEKKEYERKRFEDDMELLSLTGNLGWFNGEPAVHTHVALGNSDFHAYGGHLFEAESAVTVEIFIRLIDTKIERKFDEGIGLNLLALCKAG